MENTNFKCKTCGALLDEFAAKSVNGLVECPYCFNVWTIPKKETSPAALSFLRMGEHDLDTGKFEDALAAYKKAAELDPKEPEAYFGMALSTFRVQYLRVSPTKEGEKPRMQPICHVATQKKFTESNAYLRALVNASPEQKTEYERRGEEIDYILAEFYRLNESGVDYNCFLCVKVSDGDAKTEDSKDADYIYNLLQSKGYKPFYSERELRNVTGADYEARILYALVRSECMLVICRNEEYLETPWVKNEYTRFLKLVNDEEKESDSITVVFYGKPVERLPGRNGKLQGIDFSLREADGKIVDFVEAHTPAARARKAAEAHNKNAQAEEIRRQIEAQKKAQQELEEKLRSLQSGGIDTQNSALLEELRLAREAREREEAEKKEQARRAYLAQFRIRNGVLTDYTGKGGNVVIPDEVQAIGEGAFTGCELITSIIIPEGVTSIGALAFSECKSLSEITIPKTVTQIGHHAFRGCEDLERVEILGNLTVLEDYLFSACEALTDVTIPQSVNRFGEGVFCLCSSLKSVNIPNGTTSIKASVFFGCSSLTNIIIPKGITAIEMSTYANCSSLATITIPENVTSIGEKAFTGCTSLTKIAIPESVTSIGERAFNGCTSLTKITIPESVTSIGVSAFGYCTSLREITMPRRLAGGLFKENLGNIFGYERQRIHFTFTK